MTGLCLFLASGALAAALPVGAFTLAWTHSVEKTEWREDWSVRDGALVVERARIRGSGAGMEPPQGAVLADGWWEYVPDLPPQKELVLARSGFTADYTLCWDGQCRPLAELVPLPEEPTVTRLRSCE